MVLVLAASNTHTFLLQLCKSQKLTCRHLPYFFEPEFICSVLHASLIFVFPSPFPLMIHTQTYPAHPNAACDPQFSASTVEAFLALSDERRDSRRLARVC